MIARLTCPKCGESFRISVEGDAIKESISPQQKQKFAFICSNKKCCARVEVNSINTVILSE